MEPLTGELCRPNPSFFHEAISDLETAILENEIAVSASAEALAAEDIYQPKPIDEVSALLELGSWLGGVDSFLSVSGRPFSQVRRSGDDSDLVHELRIVRMALQRCAYLIFRLTTGSEHYAGDGNVAFLVSDLRSLGKQIRSELLSLESISRVEHLSLAEFKALGDAILERLRGERIFAAVSSLSGAEIPENLPESVAAFTFGGGITQSEIIDTISRFGRILTVLEQVGKMLERDEPLKPAMIIFARVNDMTVEMIDHLNKRVSRMGETGGEAADSIDGASYTAAIELKKAVQQELSGIMGTRAATGVYARIEAAYALLTESFQQIITVLARQIDPQANMFEMFPKFRTKLENSVRLRSELHSIAEMTRIAEDAPDKPNCDLLVGRLADFSSVAIRYLFYKDIETFERFVEEIRVTKQAKDLVPILHRFGAYLETLYAQVSMRAVLEGHPLQ